MRAFTEFLNRLVGEIGQGTLADQIGADGATLSRFRSGQGSLSMEAVDKLLDVGNAVIIQRTEWEKLEGALETISDLWKIERKRKTQAPKPGGGKSENFIG